jgi:hypothetical protein
MARQHFDAVLSLIKLTLNLLADDMISPHLLRYPASLFPASKMPNNLVIATCI